MYIEDQIKALEDRIAILEAKKTEAPDEWLTIKETAARLHVSEMTIRRRITAGDVYASTKTGCIRIPIGQFYHEDQGAEVLQMPEPKRKTKRTAYADALQEIRDFVFG